MSQATQTTPIEAPVEEPAVPVSRPRFMFAFVVLYMLFLLDFSARLGVTSVFPAMQKALGLTDSQIGVAGSAVLDGDGAGITISNQFTENVGTNLFWLRAANDNDPEMTKHDAHDALDFIGLTVPLTFDGVKVTPWGMGGIIGQDSFKGSGPDMTGIAMPGMLPLGGDAAIAASSDKDHGSIWYGGIAADVTYFEPFRFALDAAYGSVDMGTSKYKDKNFDVKRSGWYAAFLAEYKLESCTPGLLFWYSSGDDANAYNGSERLPSLRANGMFSSVMGDDVHYGGSLQDQKMTYAGTWGLGLQVADVSFMEDLKHTFRVLYWGGTNSPSMVKYATTRTDWNYTNDYEGIYLTTNDRAAGVQHQQRLPGLRQLQHRPLAGLHRQPDGLRYLAGRPRLPWGQLQQAGHLERRPDLCLYLLGLSA